MESPTVENLLKALDAIESDAESRCGTEWFQLVRRGVPPEMNLIT